MCARYQDVTICELVCLFVNNHMRWVGWAVVGGRREMEWV